MMGRKAFLAAGAWIALAVLLATPPVAPAQDYPTRAVKIIVPFPAGGTADAMPRLIGDRRAPTGGHQGRARRLYAALGAGAAARHQSEPLSQARLRPARLRTDRGHEPGAELA